MYATAALAAHARACRDGDWVVFLDLKRDRYSALPFRQADAAFWGMLGVGGVEPPVDGIGEAPGAAGLLAALRNHGLLAESEIAVKAQCSTLFIPPWAPDRVAFLAACAWARWIVRAKRLDVAAVTFSAWKERVGQGEGLNEAAQAYERARPWYPAPRICLFDSLSLLAYLLSRGASADWVIGVRGRPFAAHCWIESNGVILNSPHDQCDAHKEIMRA